MISKIYSLIFFIALLAIPNISKAQTKEETFQYVERMPSFPDGEKAMMEFLQKNIKYPASAQANKIEGRVIVSFKVMADGRLENIKALRGIDTECDNEAIRVVSMMPKWNPGLIANKPVPVSYTLPIQFSLTSKK